MPKHNKKTRLVTGTITGGDHLRKPMWLEDWRWTVRTLFARRKLVLDKMAVVVYCVPRYRAHSSGDLKHHARTSPTGMCRALYQPAGPTMPHPGGSLY